jgi:ferritin-like metal-binding protein YciE
MPLQTLEDVFNEQLKDVYSAENQILKALPKMAKSASSPELREAFEEHLEQTREQVARLDRIVEMTGITVKGKKCKGMEGLLEEGKEVLEEKSESSASALDAAMIAAAQRVEHYEISAYGSLCAYAKQLGNRDVLALLKETLSEEEETDQRLTQIAGSVNLEAAEQPERSSARKSARTRTAR